MLPVAEDRRCQSVNGRLGRVYSDTMICAGGQGRGGCQVSRRQDIAYIVVFLMAISLLSKEMWHLDRQGSQYRFIYSPRVKLQPANKAIRVILSLFKYEMVHVISVIRDFPIDFS